MGKKHFSLNKRLIKEVNRLAGNFSNENYSKIGNIDNILIKRDISVEKKKNILVKKLHGAIVKTFSIDKKKCNKKTFESLKKRLHNIRKIIAKLSSINYYLETMFLEDLRLSNIKIRNKGSKLKQQSPTTKDELEMLEYTTYRLIGEVVILDKKLLKEYTAKEKKIFGEEKTKVKDIDMVLKKESDMLEHLEAKLPPPKAASPTLLNEPLFTHWVARIFALLSYFEHIYAKEKGIFSKLKKNKKIRRKINKKITYLMKERSKLLKIMEQKAVSIRKFSADNKFRKELHNLTTTIRL